MKLLDKNDVAARIGVKPKTAAALMMQMNPVVISGTVRKRYRVTETDLEAWIHRKKMNAHRVIAHVARTGRMERK